MGRKALSELDTLVTPDTLMRWYRALVAQKWTYTHRRGPGRPRTIQVIVQLIIRMFTVEVLTLRGLVTYYILFVIDLARRTVKIAGITSHPNEVWMMQTARNLTDTEEPFLRRTRFLIMDRDTKYSAAFRAVLARERIEPIRLPPRSPNLNAYAERFVRSVKTECTGPIVFFSRSSLERVLTQYVAHYHEERNHQGLNNRLLKYSNRPIHRGGRVERRERLGGMLNFYYREVA